MHNNLSTLSTLFGIYYIEKLQFLSTLSTLLNVLYCTLLYIFTFTSWRSTLWMSLYIIIYIHIYVFRLFRPCYIPKKWEPRNAQVRGLLVMPDLSKSLCTRPPVWHLLAPSVDLSLWWWAPIGSPSCWFLVDRPVTSNESVNYLSKNRSSKYLSSTHVRHRLVYCTRTLLLIYSVNTTRGVIIFKRLWLDIPSV